MHSHDPAADYFFIDSHGGVWQICPPSAPGAVAFGPRGAACRVDLGRMGLRRAPQEIFAGIEPDDDGWVVIDYQTLRVLGG